MFFSEHSRHQKRNYAKRWIFKKVFNKNTEFMNLIGYDKNSTFKIKLF